MNTCSTCKYWKANKNLIKGECDFVDSIPCDKQPDNLRMEINVTAHDDSGLQVEFITGKDFGCIHHAAK
jgi:hypothetical protein